MFRATDAYFGFSLYNDAHLTVEFDTLSRNPLPNDVSNIVSSIRTISNAYITPIHFNFAWLYGSPNSNHCATTTHFFTFLANVGAFIASFSNGLTSEHMANQQWQQLYTQTILLGADIENFFRNIQLAIHNYKNIKRLFWYNGINLNYSTEYLRDILDDHMTDFDWLDDLPLAQYRRLMVLRSNLHYNYVYLPTILNSILLRLRYYCYDDYNIVDVIFNDIFNDVNFVF